MALLKSAQFLNSAQSLPAWLNEYQQSHNNPTNKKLHWLCVPTITFCILGISMSFSVWLTLIVILLAVFFYAQLSLPLAAIMLVIFVLMAVVAFILPFGFKTYAGLFLLAWVGQFYGHYVEGKKPSFFKDLQFLLIGPAWCMETLFTKISSRLSFT